jgi:hypothetical protein
MPDERPHQLDDYLRGASALSREYQRESALLPPPALDRKVLAAADPASPNLRTFHKSQRLAPLAFAASVFLSLAVVLALVFAPQPSQQTAAKAHVLQVRVYKSEAPRAAVTSVRERDPAMWLEDITALRRNGHVLEADVEMRRFRSVYPNYVIPSNE